MSLSVYVHIPFCASKCNYCDFYSSPASEEVKEAYVSALISQIRNSEAEKSPIKSVYFGGGTPSVLSTKQLYRILEAIHEKFDIVAAEKTLEVNPDSVLTAECESLLWFDRFSMGVQSFDDGELKLLGRRHTSTEAERAYDFLRRFSSNINLDLMIGLPSADHAEKLKKSVNRLISLSPDHASVYILKYEYGTPMYKMADKALPDDTVSDMYLYVSEALTGNGYEHYEISNYAKNGKRSRHNCAYWTQNKYLAFGTGAYGFDGKNRYHFEKDLGKFIAENGNVTPVIDETLDGEQLFSEKIMLGLRMCDGIDAEIYALITADPRKKRLCTELIKNGLAALSSHGNFALTPRGWLVSNTIIEELI